MKSTKENMKSKLSVVDVEVKKSFVKKQTVVVDFQEGKVLVHPDIKGYSINGPYLIVQEPDDTQYIYPMANVNSIKITVDTVEE